MINLTVLAPNFYKIAIGNKIFWFSYETPIAFYINRPNWNNVYIAKNQWSNTTGKHINIVKREVEYYSEVDYNELQNIMSDYINI